MNLDYSRNHIENQASSDNKSIKKMNLKQSTNHIENHSNQRTINIILFFNICSRKWMMECVQLFFSLFGKILFLLCNIGKLHNLYVRSKQNNPYRTFFVF